MSSEELIHVELDKDERDLLVAGLVQWGGPARPTEQLVIALGFAGLDAFRVERKLLWTAIEIGEPLSRQDWQRALLATEVVFASDVYGAGLDWSIVTGISDVDTIRLLRGLQRKLPRWRATWQFHVVDGAATIVDESRP
ncbi:MAG: hypothetical protein ABMA25_23285 [Ilumatobacteraceae bacterium]